MQKRRGESRLFVQNFLSHSTEKFRWGTLRCIRKFRVAKNFMHERGGGGGIKFLRRKLLSHSSEKFRLGTLWCFRKFRASQNFKHKKGISLNSVEKSLSHSAHKIRGRTLLGFQRILVSKSFKQRREDASRFCRNFFYLTGPKKLRQGTILCFRKFLVGKNILWIRGGGYHDFQSKFLSHCTEIFHWRTLWCFRKILLSKIFMHRRGRGITVLSKFFVSQDRSEKLCKGTLLFRKFSGIEKNLWIRGGSSRFSVEIFWPHSAEKFRGHPFNVSENLGYRKILCIIGGITIFLLKFFVSQCRKTSYRNPLVFH